MHPVGIDESLYSPHLVGPCVVAAAWVPEGLSFRDAKYLSREARLRAWREVQEQGIFTVALATPAEISRCGVYEARNAAARSALRALAERLGGMSRVECDLNLYYGLRDSEFASLLHPLKRAGERSARVAAASIVARCYADLLLAGMRALWPEYDLGVNVTAAHRRALRERGTLPVHRRGVYARKWWERLLGGEPCETERSSS